MDIRIGILTIREKWEKFLGHPVEVLTKGTPATDNAVIFPANIIPSRKFVASLPGEKNPSSTPDWEAVKIIQHPWHIFSANDWALRQDYELITSKKISVHIPESVQVTNARQIFIEPGASLSHCILNAADGPIYIGKDAEVMEGASIRGPFALCEGAVVKMGARIYGATTIGPYCTVGGEIKNSVIFGYSNKAHHGYLGDAVIGEWCNLGAGTSNSNVKNNAGEIKIWNNPTKEFVNAGLKCGLLMGDYSRSAINTSFNTGTVVGICCSIFQEGLTSKFIPNFTWGNETLSKYEFEKALVDIENWKRLKGQNLTEEEIGSLKRIFEEN